MDEVQMIEHIFKFVRDNGAIIPRTYKTMGGMWTVDRYKCDLFPDLVVELGDEGYTQAVKAPGLIVSSTYGRKPFWTTGTSADLKTLYNRMFNDASVLG